MFGITTTEVLVLGVVGVVFVALVAFVSRKPRTGSWVRPRRVALPFDHDKEAEVPADR
jgi:hypothetical protein